MKRKNIIRRLTMSPLELDIYYCEQRKHRFEQEKRLTHIQLRKALYPIFFILLKLDRLFRRQKIIVMGNRKKYQEQVIYACTHIGENDLENIYETIHQGCWWFVGDPSVLYRRISGLIIYLNGCIFLNTGDKEDRRIAYLRSVELLRNGGSLMIFPEGARNGFEELPVMQLFQGTAKMAIETNTKIIPIAIEQYDRRFIINFGNELLPKNFDNSALLTEKLRDDLATLKWEIWETEGVSRRKDLPVNYSELFAKEFENRIYPYDTVESIERSRFHTKEEDEQKDARNHLDKLIPCKENAFLLRYKYKR